MVVNVQLTAPAPKSFSAGSCKTAFGAPAASAPTRAKYQNAGKMVDSPIWLSVS
jgi:hypothetical protein